MPRGAAYLWLPPHRGSSRGGAGAEATRRRAPSRASLQAGVRVRVSVSVCAGGGGRNKEPSKHGESVSSKAHKYSSRVLISPTHTRARRNTARAPVATPPLAQQQSPKLLLQTVRDCTGMGAAGGRRTHSHTPRGRLMKGPLPAPSILQTLCRERRRAQVPRAPAPRPKLCRIAQEGEGGGTQRGKGGELRGGSCLYLFLPSPRQDQGKASSRYLRSSRPREEEQDARPGPLQPLPRPRAPGRLPGGARVPR